MSDQPKKKPGKQAVYKGTNSQGSAYTKYDDGSFYYSNKKVDGKTESSYYDTGKGAGFFTKNGPDGYKFYENKKEGFRNYLEKAPKKEPKNEASK